MSNLMFKTEKEVASDAHLPSHQLLLRAGYIKQVSSGIYSLTPLALRVLQNIINIVREEMNQVNGQEVLLPIAQPASLWEESGRYDAIDSSLVRFQDRNGQNMVLAMTHEEAVTDLVRQFVRSYRQLPLMVYQIQLKFRDEARPRGGLVRLREFLMKDGYSFHATMHSLNEFYEQMIGAYELVYKRCGIHVLKVESDTGMMGGGGAHEFMVVAEGGEDTLLICHQCGYAANQEVAVARHPSSQLDGTGTTNSTSAEPLKKIHTPNVPTIDALTDFLKCEAYDILKCVLYMADEHVPVMACVRGDQQVNEIKLMKLLKVISLRAMSPVETEHYGLTPGYVSAIGSANPHECVVAVDDTVVGAENLVAGANEYHHHYLHATFGREFIGTLTGDISSVNGGDLCVTCGSPLSTVRGIEVGNIFKLGTKYSAPMEANFTDPDGVIQPMIMGCYGIGITRMLACIVEQHHDEKGIIFPPSIAPYKYHLVSVGTDPDTIRCAEELYARLGHEAVLYDNREVTAGVKFMDADLLGMPLRITVSKRSLAAGGVEIYVRKTGHTEIVTPDVLVQHLEEEL